MSPSCRYPTHAGWHIRPADAPCTLPPPTHRSARPAARMAGLSRLEFALCVVVIGILAALAFDRMLPWLASWHAARLQQAVAAVQAADTRFQMACSARSADRDCPQLTLDGLSIDGAFGHPAASATGIARLARLPELGLALHEVRRDGVPALVVAAGPNPSRTCEFTYVQPPKQGAAAEIVSFPSSCL